MKITALVTILAFAAANMATANVVDDAYDPGTGSSGIHIIPGSPSWRKYPKCSGECTPHTPPLYCIYGNAIISTVSFLVES
ncbi:hypothetical protein V8E51_007625 [Hyaloscypha variabilis]